MKNIPPVCVIRIGIESNIVHDSLRGEMLVDSTTSTSNNVGRENASTGDDEGGQGVVDVTPQTCSYGKTINPEIDRTVTTRYTLYTQAL